MDNEIFLTNLRDNFTITETDWLNPFYVYGLGGNDRIVGTEGRIFVFGGRGKDVIIGSDHHEGIVSNLGILRGEGGFDKIKGGLGAEKLFGGRGRDTLIGGEDDTLDGGQGRDRFILEYGEENVGRRTINDYTPGEDKIKFRHSDNFYDDFDDMIENWVEEDTDRGNVVIRVKNGDVLLKNTTIEELQEDDFLF